LSDPFVKLSDVERKPPDILSDGETEVYCLSDPSILQLSDVNQISVAGDVKWKTSLSVDCQY
jgi:hypothetical protein